MQPGLIPHKQHTGPEILEHSLGHEESKKKIAHYELEQGEMPQLQARGVKLFFGGRG